MDFLDKKILITGNRGFIGCHLENKLKQLGANVLGYDIKDGFNLLDKYQVETVIQTFDPEIIFHLGAVSQVSISVNNPYNTFLTNFYGTLNILETARINHTSRIILASSDKAYGYKDKPYIESMSLDAINPYDTSKASVDLMVKSYIKTYNMNITTSRFCNIFGPADLNWLRIVPSTIRSCYRGNSPILRSNGLAGREYLYIEDCVDAYIKLIDADDSAYNFGGHYMQVIDMVDMIALYFDESVIPVVLNNAQAEIQDQRLDYTKATIKLGWNPTTSISEGISKTVEWYKEYFEGKYEPLSTI